MEEDRQEVYVIGGKISHVKLPSKIIEELDVWKKECDKIKNHPLSFLKNHENAGSLGNFYQTSVPYNLVDNSFWLAFTLRCCAQLYGGVHKDYHVRTFEGHFDNDIWINYSYKGNSNPVHDHKGTCSGVIYYSNKDTPTIFNDDNIKFNGRKGDMIIFPSYLKHHVEKQEDELERITFAFNINYEDSNARS